MGKLSKVEKDALEDIVYNYKSKYEEGLTEPEQLDILSNFPQIEKREYMLKLGVHTGIIKGKDFLTFSDDVYYAILQCLESRDPFISEWD